MTAPSNSLASSSSTQLRLDDDAPRAGLERGDGERAAVDALARQAEEEVARLDPRASR